MMLGRPEALLLLLLLLPLAWLAVRARVPIHGWQRTFTFSLQALAIVLLTAALADLHVRTAPKTTRIAITSFASGAGAPEREAAARLVEQWREALPFGEHLLERTSQGSLAASLESALAEVPAAEPGEIALLGDGLSVGDDPAPALAAATSRGVRIHARVFANAAGPRLVFVRHPARVAQREPTALVAAIEAPVEAPAEEPMRLEVWQGGEKLAERAIMVPAGASLHRISVLARGEGAIALETRIVPATGFVAARCAEATALLVEGTLAVLHVGEDAQRAAALATTLAPFGVSVTGRTPTTLDAASLQSAHVLVVDDVAAARWTTERLHQVRAEVLESGLGLLVAGARRGASTGGYAETPLADVLPIDPSAREERRDPSVGLVIVLDTSGSMGGARIELAKEVARLALRRLQPHDKAGIVEFYGSRRWAAPLQPAANAIELQRALDRLQAGGGTIVYSALEESYYALLGAKSRYKHVLVLTDGGVESGPFESLARRMADSNIQVHSVLIGPQGNSPFLQSLSQWGRGRFYACPSRFELPELRFMEPETAPLSSLREGVLPVDALARSEAAQALGGDSLPPVGAWNEATPRDGASALLTGPNGGAVLSAWDQGAGRVGAMLTDLQPSTETGLQRDPRYGAFLADLLRTLARGKQAANHGLELVAKADVLAITVRKSAATEALVTTAGTSSSRSVPLVGQGNDLRGAEIPWRDGAPVVVEVAAGGRVLRGAACRPLPQAARGSDASQRLRTLAEASGGTSAAGPLPVSTGLAALPTLRPFARTLALLALLAFLLAVLARRLPRLSAARLAGTMPKGLALLVMLPLLVAPALAQEDSTQARITRELAQKGNLDVLLADPKLDRALRIEALRAEGRPDDALALLDSKRAQDRWPRVLLLEANGKLDAARRELATLLADQALPVPERAAMLVRAAELAFAAGDETAAATAIDSAVALAQSPELTKRLALLAGGYGRLALALRLAEPFHEPAMEVWRAFWCEGERRYDDAFAAWSKAATGLTLEREKRHAWLRALEVRRQQGKLSQLVEDWRSADDPNRKGLVLHALRELARGEDALAILAKGAGNIDEVRDLLLLSTEAGKSKQAEQIVRAQLAKAPNDVTLRSSLALALVDDGQAEAAQALIAQALPGAATRNVLAYAELAKELGLAATLRACIDALAKSDKGQDQLDAILLEVHELRRRKQDEAVKLLLASRQKITQPSERARIAELLESLGQRAEALALWREVADATKAEDVLMHLAWLLTESSDPKERLEAVVRYEQLWLTAGAEARRRDAEGKALDAAAREGRLADLAIRLEKELGDPATEQKETKRAALLRIYARAKDSAGAEAVLAKDLANPARAVEARLALAQVLLECQELGRYTQCLEELRKLDPEHELDYVQQLSYAALERGNPAQARQLVKDLLDGKGLHTKGPLPDSARELAAGVLALCGKPTEAVTAYRRALAQAPDRVETWLLLGNALQKAGKTERAHAMYCDIIEQEPPDDLLLVAIDGLLNLDAPPPLVRFAERALRRRVAQKPDKVYLLRALQDVLEELKDEKARLRALGETLLVAGEQRASFVRELAEEARTKGDLAGQASHGRLLLAIGDEVPPAVLVEVGESLLQSKDWASADRAFERARFTRELSSVEKRIVTAYLAAGRLGDAERMLRRALRRDPDEPEPKLALAKLLERRGKLSEATALAQTVACQLVPSGIAAVTAAASRPDRAGGGRAGGAGGIIRLPNAGVPGSGRNQEQATGPSYEEARQLALRCASRPQDLEPLVAAVSSLAQTDPTRRIPAALELRSLAAALDDAGLMARADSIVDAAMQVPGTGPSAAEKRALFGAYLAAGDAERASAFLEPGGREPGGRRTERDQLKLELMRGADAESLAKGVSGGDRAALALALWLRGDVTAARSLVVEAAAQPESRPTRGGAAAARSPLISSLGALPIRGGGSTSLLARLMKLFGIASQRDPSEDARVEEILSAPTALAKLAQMTVYLRSATNLTKERRTELVRSLLPLFDDDTAARFAANFLDVARDVIAPAELAKVARKGLLNSNLPTPSLFGLAALDLVEPEGRAEVLDTVLAKVPAADRDTQLLLALAQMESCSTETRVLVASKLSGKPVATTARTWLTNLANEPALDPAVARAILDRVPKGKEPALALLALRAAKDDAERAEIALKGLQDLAGQDDLDQQPWRLAERLATFVGEVKKKQMLDASVGNPAAHHAGERVVRAALLADLGDEPKSLATLVELFATRPSDSVLLSSIINRATQLGLANDALAALRGYVAQASNIYMAQASSLASLLLDQGAPEEALALLHRIETGTPPLKLELRAIAGLRSKEQRESEGRRVFQGGGRNDSARIVFAGSWDQGSAAPTLADALEAGATRASLWDLLQADSSWAPLATFPEGLGILESQIRVLSASDRLLGLDQARAWLQAAAAAGRDAEMLAKARQRLARVPFAPDALALVLADKVRKFAPPPAPQPAQGPDAELRRYALVTALREPFPSGVLAELALIARAVGDQELADRIVRVVLADRDGLTGGEIKTLLPAILDRFTVPAETLLALAPSGPTPTPDLDALLLARLSRSELDPERVRAAFACVGPYLTKSRIRTEGLVLPWLGIELRCGHMDAAAALIKRIMDQQDNYESIPAFAYAAAVPPLARWQDPAQARELATLVLDGARGASVSGRMTCVRLAGLLAVRLEEAGRTEEAQSLRSQLGVRFAGVPNALAWLAGGK